VVYLVWGSTYLAIRVGVRDIPPLMLAALRYVAAGLLLYPIAIRSGTWAVRHNDVPRGRQWLAAALVGVLLLVLGNGGVTVAETSLNSGFAALLVATVPLWMVAFAWPIDRIRPTGWAATGLVIGLIGVAVLAGGGHGSGQLWAIVVVLGAAASWGLGSVLAHRLSLPRRALLAAALEMLVAGIILFIAALAHGDVGQIHWSRVGIGSWVALAYLTVLGSMLAFSAYGYALGRLPLTTVSTYAYVNPVVAVLLGAVILSEPLSANELIGAVLVLASVVLALRSRVTARIEASIDVAARRPVTSR
jgi:drug/metabolite transporter (DMT)-like permease